MSPTAVIELGHQLLHTLRLERDQLEKLIARLDELGDQVDRRSAAARRRLLARLRPLVIAHCRAEQEALCATLRAAHGHLHFGRIERAEHDLIARLEQLEQIPPEHPFWRLHFDELTRRLRAHLERGQQVHREACRMLGASQLAELDLQFRRIRQETLEQLKHDRTARR
jgi:hypothetical protein